MTFDANLPLYLIVFSQALLLAAACLALSRFQRRCREMEDFWDSPTGAMLAEERQSSEQRIVSVASEHDLKEKLKLDQRVNDLQRQLNALTAKPPEKTSVLPFEIERNLPIEHASRMAKQGASVEELTRTCGLNIGEARLLQKLHGRQQLRVNEG